MLLKIELKSEQRNGKKLKKEYSRNTQSKDINKF